MCRWSYILPLEREHNSSFVICAFKSRSTRFALLRLFSLLHNINLLSVINPMTEWCQKITHAREPAFFSPEECGKNESGDILSEGIPEAFRGRVERTNGSSRIGRSVIRRGAKSGRNHACGFAGCVPDRRTPKFGLNCHHQPVRRDRVTYIRS